jgi:pimeloyl-ACP methyl ester carboxylesterase
MDAPAETHYARSGDVFLAYQVIGAGPVDLVFSGPLVGHVELIWEDAVAARFLRRLASFGRLIMFDKRGVGMSDPVALGDLPTLEQRADDLLTVMDEAESRQAIVIGSSEGGQVGILLAAMHPERVAGLVLHATYARLLRAADFPAGIPEDSWINVEHLLATGWGTPSVIELVMPSVAGDEHRLRWWCEFCRRASSPGAAVAQARVSRDIDVRDALPSVRTPTLVLHAQHERWMRAAHGRFLAEHIEGARLVELPGADHLPFGDHADLVASEIEEFATGAREPVAPERVLVTLLVSDIVSSTATLADLGDGRWRELLDAHDRVVRRQLGRFRGREVKATGDGFLATFDGPARAIRCAESIRDATRALGLSIRVGVHTGEVELRGGDIAGMAVHIGERVCAAAEAGEILVSAAVPLLVAGSGISFADRGTHQLRGLPDSWHLHAVSDG